MTYHLIGGIVKSPKGNKVKSRRENKMKFTINEKQNGELAVRTLSEKAKRGYNETEGIEVYEYEGDDGKMYAVKSIDGIREDMAIEELEEYLEGWVCGEDD